MSDSKPLTGVQITAAKLLVDGNLSIAEVAESVGVDQRTIYRWREWPDFVEEMRRISDLLEQGYVASGLAVKRNRVQALNDRARLIRKVIAERGAAPENAEAAGGTTGILARDVKGAGGQIVTVHAADVALLKELREIEKQIAIETGQWVEKMAPTDPSGENEFALTDEDRAARALALLDIARTRRTRQADGPEEGEPMGSESGTADGGDSVTG